MINLILYTSLVLFSIFVATTHFEIMVVLLLVIIVDVVCVILRAVKCNYNNIHKLYAHLQSTLPKTHANNREK